MKLVRYGPVGGELPGILDRLGHIRALSPVIQDIGFEILSPESLAVLSAIDVDKLPLVPGKRRFGVPVANLRQIIAIGLNYRDHAEEAHLTVPEYPLQFAKSIGSLSGCTDDLVVPSNTEKLDWELELGVVIGTEARDVPLEKALNYVAGYCTTLDVSERAWQLERGGQHGKGKSYDAFTPVGPWLVTADEIADPQALSLHLDVNGEPRQRGSTKGMVFSVSEIICHVSQYQTLLAGDLIMTGSPAGVAYGMVPPKYLRFGDVVTAEIGGLGTHTHWVRQGNRGAPGSQRSLAGGRPVSTKLTPSAV